jgi:hypothetical protein
MSLESQEALTDGSRSNTSRIVKKRKEEKNLDEMK